MLRLPVFSMMISERRAVSYTHLDVYKRQDLALSTEQDIDNAVNGLYDLDVYKRQVMDEEFLNQAVKEAKISPGFKKILGTAKTLKKAGNRCV